ncbi:MAG: stage sporulation protein [Bacillota bacterium]|nr:stage sporulation protein [Bacillota bacterium]MDK2927933.1 stage sporulation protein [Bacillota bacterium]
MIKWGERRLPPQVERISLLVEKGELAPPAALAGLRQVDEPLLTASATGAHSPLAEALAQLDALVGLEEVKQLVYEIKAFIEIQQRRRQEGLATEPLTLHMVFRGNPGTGKTTVARILGTLFKELGVLSKGHLVEVERADLVGEYIGHTAQKTREQIKRSLGGILFVDEAYSLARGGDKDFGKESIDCLVKAMEDHRGDLVLILAGYREEMDYFLQTNPGLRSRFPIKIDFPDYSLNELLEIAQVFLAQRDYYLSPGAREELLRQLQVTHNFRHSGNARLVRNIIERAIRRQAVRLAGQSSLSRDQLMAIERVDLEGGAAA